MAIDQKTLAAISGEAFRGATSDFASNLMEATKTRALLKETDLNQKRQAKKDKREEASLLKLAKSQKEFGVEEVPKTSAEAYALQQKYVSQGNIPAGDMLQNKGNKLLQAENARFVATAKAAADAKKLASKDGKAYVPKDIKPSVTESGLARVIALTGPFGAPSEEHIGAITNMVNISAKSLSRYDKDQKVDPTDLIAEINANPGKFIDEDGIDELSLAKISEFLASKETKLLMNQKLIRKGSEQGADGESWQADGYEYRTINGVTQRRKVN